VFSIFQDLLSKKIAIPQKIKLMITAYLNTKYTAGLCFHKFIVIGWYKNQDGRQSINAPSTKIPEA